MRERAIWNRQAMCFVGIVLFLGLIIAIHPAWAADLTVSSVVGQQTLADGDTLTVQSGGAVAVDNDDVEMIADYDGDISLDAAVTAVKGDEESIFVTNGSVTVEDGGSISATVDASTAEITLEGGQYLDDGYFARAIAAESGAITITNAGTLSSQATSAYADEDIHAFTIQIFNESEDPATPATTIINSGTINATATSDEDYTYARGIQTCEDIENLSINNSGTITAVSTSVLNEANARAIKIGQGSNGTITNSGMLSATATSNTDDQGNAWGIQIGRDSTFTITNTVDGTISASAMSDGDQAKAWGIKLGSQDAEATTKHSIINLGSIFATASGGGYYSKATGIQFEDGGSVLNLGTITANLTVVDEDDADYSKAIGIFAADIDDLENNYVTITNAAGASITVDSTYELEGDVDDSAGAIGIKVSDGYLNGDTDETSIFKRTINNAGDIKTSTKIDAVDIDRNTGAIGIKTGYTNNYISSESNSSTSSLLNISNTGTINATSTLTAVETIEDNAGSFGIRTGSTYANLYSSTDSSATSATSITNTGSITVLSTLNAIDYDDPTGAFGIKTGYVQASGSSNTDCTATATLDINNTGSISATTSVTATDFIVESSGAYGIRAGQTYNYSGEGFTATTTINNSASGTIAATATITAPELSYSNGAYGIRVGDDDGYEGEGVYNVNVSNAGSITADATLTTDYENSGNNYNRGAFGIRTGSAKVVNSGTITSTAIMNGLNDSACDGAYGIRTGDGEATVVHSGSITATLTDNDTTTLQRAVGIMTGRDYNQIYLSGSVAASATGGKAYSVVMGCEDYDGFGNALFVMNGASLFGDLLNGASSELAGAVFGLAKNAENMADFGDDYANYEEFGAALDAVGSAEEFAAAIVNVPVDDDFSITINNDFLSTNEDGWGAVLLGGTTTINNSEQSLIDEMFVGSDATIGGNLYVDNLRLMGTAAPGNSVGTITVADEFNHESGATYAVEVGSNQTSDLIAVGDEAVIEEGAKVTVASVGYVDDGDTYTILTAGTLDGQYAAADLSYPSLVLDYELDYSVENSVQLVASRTPYSDIDLTNNSLSAASGLIAYIEAGGTGADEFIGELDNMGSVAGMEQVLDALTPDQYANLIDASLSGSNLYRSLLIGRMGNLHLASNYNNTNKLTESGPALSRIPLYLDRENDISGWFRVMYMGGSQDNDGDHSGYDSDTLGFSLGFDKKIGNNLALGVGFGVTQSDVDFNHSIQETDIDSMYGSVYGTYFTDKFYIDAAISYVDNEYDSERRIALYSMDATSSTDGTEFGVFLGGGFHLVDTESMYFTPTVSVTWSDTEVDSFVEHGLFDLQISDYDADSLVSKLGFRWGGKIGLAETELSLAWAHEFGDTDRDVRVGFVNGPTTFQLNGIEPDRDSAIVGLGVNLITHDVVTFYVDYDGEFRSDFDAHSISAGMRWVF